ncbi:peptidase S8/S53 domain-containing protein [Limtongia smithiae]|uniref:peptidase S8/S53 domain-containing protein n=1 Tax=Limtongia smithiae TaxID=1125753 RepID=UPI0034CE7D8A
MILRPAMLPHTSTFWRVILLLAVLLVESTVGGTALHPRSHILPREYSERDYYAIELVWPEQYNDDSLAMRIAKFASDNQLRFEEPVGSLKDIYLFSAPKSVSVQESSLRRRSIDDDAQPIQYFEKMTLKKLHKRGPIPDDRPPPVDSSLLPLRELEDILEIHDPEFEKQWHLMNPMQRGHDVNVSGVWLQNITGVGIVTAIVDDGLDFDSEDLHDSFFAKGSYDFNDQNPLPKPRLSDDRHGTRCAGEIAAVKNDVCGIGVAYNSKVAGIRILSKEITDADEAIALNYAMQDNHIYSCSWGPADDGQTMEAPGELIKRAFINGVENGRGGLGSIYVFASGNGAQNGDNCNFDGYTNSIYSITVGAIDRKGLHPYYAEDCSAQLIVTYSSGSGDHIHTTDVGERACTDQHGGTSAAAPLAAGIFSLVLSVRPELTWRDMQYLAMDTAIPVTNGDANVQTTSIGKKFSHRYGYGKIDTYAIVEAAKTWELVRPQSWYQSPPMVVKQDIPSGTDGLSSTINVSEDDMAAANQARLEHVQVTVNIIHRRRGDIGVQLESPAGVISYLAVARIYDQDKEGMKNWTFMSVAHWGELGVGAWKLTVLDTINPDFTGKLMDWSIKLWGESIDATKASPVPLEPLPTETEPPVTTETADPEASATESPVSGGETDDSYFKYIPTFGMASDKVFWVYGAGLLIILFIVLVITFFCMHRRRRNRLSRGMNGEEYEFSILRNPGDSGSGGGSSGLGGGRGGRGGRRKARDLYDAFENIDEDDAFAVEDLLSEAEDEEDEDDDMYANDVAVARAAGAKLEQQHAAAAVTSDTTIVEDEHNTTTTDNVVKATSPTPAALEPRTAMVEPDVLHEDERAQLLDLDVRGRSCSIQT